MNIMSFGNSSVASDPIIANPEVHSNASVADSPRAPRTVRETIEWLQRIGLPPLPNCPRCASEQGKQPKQPCYLGDDGIVYSVSWKPWQEKMPPEVLLKKWFKSKEVGVGTLGRYNGSHWLTWVDVDQKNFDNQELCDAAVTEWCNQYPVAAVAPAFRSPSGGYRFFFALSSEPPNFKCNGGFSFKEDGSQRIGEVLTKSGGHTLLPPSFGVDGKAYEWVQWSEYPPVIEKLEDIGVYPVQTKTNTVASGCSSVAPVAPVDRKQKTPPNSANLTDLLNKEIYPRLNLDQAFNWEGHDFKEDGTGKVRGNCPWHDSKSGTAFYASRKNGTLVWRCPACEIGGDVIAYRHRLAGGNGSPRGKEFVNLVRQLAQFVNVPMPKLELQKQPSKNIHLEDQPEEDKPQIDLYNWNAPKSWQGEIGYWKTVKSEEGESQAWIPKCNFDFAIEREIMDTHGGGFVIVAKLACSPSQHRFIIRSEDCYSSEKFVKVIKRGIGRNVVCNLTNEQLGALLAVKQAEYEQTRDGRIFRAVERYGRQDDGTWVFKNIQFTRDGEITDESKTGWVFTELGEEDAIPCPIPAPPNKEALKELIDAARRVFGAENFHQFLLVVGWVVASLQFQKILDMEGAFPELNAYGDPGTGKTLAAEAALSLIGTNWSREGMLSKASVSAIYEHLKCSGSIPFIWDDPERAPEIDEFAKNMYNAKPRLVRGNRQQPNSSIGYTTNHQMGGDQDATYTRIVRDCFVPGGDPSSVPALKEAQKKASGALPDLIKLGYPKNEIGAIEIELLPHLPLAHHRIAWNLAIVTYYADAVVRMVGATENCLRWIKTNLCPSENNSENTGNSLQDFITKVLALEAEDKVGSWNLKEDKNYVHLYAESVWLAVDKTFNPKTYNKKSLRAMVEKAGGRIDGYITFHASKDEILAYQRARLTNGTHSNGNPIEPNPPRTTRKKAWSLPKELFYSNATTVTTVTEVLPEAVTGGDHVISSISGQISGTVTTVSTFLSVERERERENIDSQHNGGSFTADELSQPEIFRKSGDFGCSSAETLDAQGIEGVTASGNTPVTPVTVVTASLSSPHINEDPPPVTADGNTRVANHEKTVAPGCSEGESYINQQLQRATESGCTPVASGCSETKTATSHCTKQAINPEQLPIPNDEHLQPNVKVWAYDTKSKQWVKSKIVEVNFVPQTQKPYNYKVKTFALDFLTVYRNQLRLRE